PVFAGLHGISIEARSSQNTFALGASLGASLFAGVAGAVSVEVINADTFAHVAGGAALNGRHDPSVAGADQAVNISATNTLHDLSIAGSAGLGLAAGVGASVDVAIIRNDTEALLDGSARARGDVDVNAIAERELSS